MSDATLHRGHVRLALTLLLLAVPLAIDPAFAQVPDGLAGLEPDAVDATAEVASGGSRLWQGVGMVLLTSLGLLLWRVLRQTGTTLIYLGSFALIFAGERLWPDGAAHWLLTGLGVVGVVATVAIRLRASTTEADESRRKAERIAMFASLIGAASLLAYLLTLTGVVGAFGFDEDAGARWKAVWSVMIPITWLCGTLPMVFIDRVIAQHPVLIPPRAASIAAQTGLATALGLCLVFPVNYLATKWQYEYDAAYFKTTSAGTATLALVRTLPEPVTAYLFFPAGSDVREAVAPYFRDLSQASGGLLTVENVDQALVPQLSEELKIRENGYVVFVRGDTNEKFKVGDDLDRARSRLKKLDQTVQQHLLSLAKGKRTVYLLTGHGEASPREKDNPVRKLNLFKQLMDSLNFRVENLGVAEGSADAIPDDAAAVIVAAPEKPLLPEENRALTEYLDRGGRLMVMVEPGEDPMTDVLGHLGLKAGDAPLAHSSAFIRQQRGVGDRVLLVTNRFGSHESITTLSRNSTQLAVVVPTVTWIDKVDGGTGKVTTLVRSMPDTWNDVIGNREKDDTEQSKVWDLAVAVSGGPKENEFRAIVIGDVNLFSDPVLQYSQGNALFAADGLRWLVGDEALAGETQSEEDVRIQHTRDEDVMWFWSTIFAMPAFILIGGVVFIRIRRSR